MTLRKPVIGITLDWQWGGSFSSKPHYALRCHYAEAIAAAGGLPIMLPLDGVRVHDYLTIVDGLVIPGGSFPLPAKWFHVAPPPEATKGYSPRADIDLRYIAAALQQNKPLLAICAGCQELVVALGGQLNWQWVNNPNRVANGVDHYGTHPERPSPGHTVTVLPGLLQDILGVTEIATNSDHHGGIAQLGNAVQAGYTPDGSTEAVVASNHPFALGVMWHPEYLVTQHDRKLWQALIGAAR